MVDGAPNLLYDLATLMLQTFLEQQCALFEVLFCIKRILLTILWRSYKIVCNHQYRSFPIFQTLAAFIRN